MEEAAGSGVVRVATLNLWGRHGAWDERRLVLVDGLRELRPDVIAFQEAVVIDEYDQVADVLGSGYYVPITTLNPSRNVATPRSPPGGIIVI